MLRVGIVCDLQEEQWPSMDLVGDMLLDQFAKGSKCDVEGVRLRPKMRRNWSALPLLRTSRRAWNADRLLNRSLYYPLWLRAQKRRFDLFHIIDHSYAQLAWQTEPARTVVTCHDLEAFSSLLSNPTQRRPGWFRAYSRHILTGMQRAAHVVCVSETVRAGVLAHGLIPRERTSVVYNGVHPSCGPEPRAGVDEEAARLIGAPPKAPLLLHVGSTVRRKRLDIVLEVFASVRQKRPNTLLVRVGGPLTPEQTAHADRLGVLAHIVQLPFLDRDLLAAVYRQCSVLILPSEVEGFGLPVIEAMACGCPVVATDIPVLREVGGAAAAYAPLLDKAVWVNQVLAILDEAEPEPEALTVRRMGCLQNAQRFSWTAAAQQLATLYGQLASQ